MPDGELVKLKNLIMELDDAIDRHVRELASLADHNGYADQAVELHQLMERRRERNAALMPHDLQESLNTIEDALQCSMRELHMVSCYLNRRAENKRRDSSQPMPYEQDCRQV